MSKFKQPDGFGLFLGIFLVLAAGLGGGWILLHRLHERRVVRLNGERLEATAQTLAGRLEEWRRERLADARVLALAPALEGIVRSAPGPAQTRELRQRLAHVRRLYGYESVAVLDLAGRARMATPEGAAPGPDAGALLGEMPALHEERGAAHDHMHLVALAGVEHEGRRLGVVAATSRADDAVGGILQSSPPAGRTAEAVVLSESGGSIHVIADSRGDPTDPERRDLDALVKTAAPVLGEGWGFFEAVDGRGREVLAVAARVPGSPWFVLAKVDRQEALASDGAAETTVALLFTALLALAGLGTYVGWLTQRRAAEARLRESRHRYDRLFHNALSGMAIHEVVRDEAGRTVDYVFLDVNPAFEGLTGLRRPDVVGRRASEVLPGIEKTPFFETYGRVVLSGEPAHFEEYSEPLGRHYAVNAYPLDERTFGTIFVDVTSRREAETALRESEGQLRAVFEGSLDPILVADDEGRLVDVNPAALSAFGRDRDEILGRTIAELVAEPDSDFEGRWRAFLEAGRATGPLRARGRDGTTRTFDFSASAGAAPGRHIWVLRDVTERVEVEKARRERERLLQLVLETIPVGVWLLDRTGRVTYGNPAARRIWGGARFVGLDEFDVFKGWRLPGREPLQPGEWGAARAVTKGVATFGEALEIQGFDGVHRQIVASAQPIRDETGATVGVLVTNEDVTEQRRLENHVRQAQKMEAVGRLAGGVAHDFNNLLAIVVGRVAALRRLLPDEHGGRRHVEEIFDAAERATALTRQLLAFGRKELQQRRPVHLEEVVEGLLPMLVRLLGEDVQVRTELERDPAPVLADPHQMEQVLVNLLVNARDAMPAGGTVTLATSTVVVETVARWRHPGLAPGRYVRLSVADTGSGMDAETLARVFEPFFSTKEASQGTGLGLATVYGIVTQNDGHVAVDSEPGRGTTFLIHLPVTEQPVEDEEAGAEPPPELPGGTETILVVEDEASLGSLIREDLEELGYTVLSAASPAEALGLAASHPGRLDLVLTDVILPKMNGRELVERLAEERRGIAAVYMSGYTADVIARHGVLGPGVHFVQKPFSTRDLAARIRESLDAAR